MIKIRIYNVFKLKRRTGNRPNDDAHPVIVNSRPVLIRHQHAANIKSRESKTYFCLFLIVLSLIIMPKDDWTHRFK